MLAVYNQHLLLSGTPVIKFRGKRYQHTPLADTPHSRASSSYDLADSFLAEGVHSNIAPLLAQVAVYCCIACKQSQ